MDRRRQAGQTDIATAGSARRVSYIADRKADQLLYREIVEASSAPILVIATSGSQPVQYANEAFWQLTGYRDFETVGRNWIEFFSLQGTSAALNAALKAISAGRSSHHLLWAARRDGSQAFVKCKVSPIGDRDGTVTQCVMVLHDMTAERREHDTLEIQAHFDALTGLANRHLLYARFDEMLAQALEWGQHFSVVLLDMNDFKSVNDHFGHETGDELLKCVGERLTGALRAHDMAARIGGDEFALLLADTHAHGGKPLNIERIVEAVQEPALLKGQQIRPSCCIGVSHCPDQGVDRETLLRVADRALYRAKRSRLSQRPLSRS